MKDKHSRDKMPDDSVARDEAGDPKHAGKSTTRRGEDVAKQEPEAGRYPTGPKGKTGRPAGKSTARDVTGVDPQDPITEDDDPESGSRGG